MTFCLQGRASKRLESSLLIRDARLLFKVVAQFRFSVILIHSKVTLFNVT